MNRSVARLLRPLSLIDSPEGSRVLSEARAFALGDRMLQVGDFPRIESTARAVTRVANGRVLMQDDGTALQVGFYPDAIASNAVAGMFIATDRLDDEAIRTLIQQAADLNGTLPSTAPPARSVQAPQRYTPVSLWHDTTLHAMDDARHAAADQVLDAFAQAKVQGAATIGIIERAVSYIDPWVGVRAYCVETDAEVTVTARSPDGTASGWAGQAARDWGRIAIDGLIARAIDLAQRSANPQAVEPGRYTVILEPSAVVQLMSRIAPCFDAQSADNGQTPLSENVSGGNKLGQRILDPRISLSSDPNDPEGGFPPFFESSRDSNAFPGMPVSAMVWVDHGVLKNMAYSLDYALNRGKAWSTLPYSVRMRGGTATVEDMIANCQQGLYVNRFSNVEMLDKTTGMLTGVTRDGCFLVKDGKIDRPVRNLRFVDSPFFFLNRLEMIGVPSRAAFGYSPPSEDQTETMGWPPVARVAQWPPLPVIVPPIMVRDFNFVALSDAI